MRALRRYWRNPSPPRDGFREKSPVPRTILLITLIATVAIACSAPGYPGVVSTPTQPPSGGDGSENPPAHAFPATEPTPLTEPAPVSHGSSTPTYEPRAPAPTPTGTPAPSVSAAAVSVLDEASGTLLYARNASRPLPPASLTKIATAVVALESRWLDETATVDIDSREMKSSTVMGLLPGDRFSLRDLLYGLMLPSGNDAALAIGHHIAGSDAAFVEMMNALATRLGLEDTHFENAHGLSARGHFSSAHDFAFLARHAMGIPAFREIVGTRTHVASGTRTIELSNVNPFLLSYHGADGVKTGYTWRSGRTMLASATRDGHRVYVVLLNAPEMEKDAQALMDWAFASFRWPA
jgi:serine-type D-Ala-D-Ala carboxypeptidase (penicillin-binding protein 5/6)